MRVLLITAVALAAILAIAATIRVVDQVNPDTPDEAAALRTLATISDNEAKYAVEHGGSYATFAQLVVEGYLDHRSSPFPDLQFVDSELMDKIKQMLALCIVQRAGKDIAYRLERPLDRDIPDLP